MKKIFSLSSVVILFSTQSAFSQGIRNAELNATPLALNPAFTGKCRY